MIVARMIKSLDAIRNHKDFIIVGAGKIGGEVKNALDELHKNVIVFLDNHPENHLGGYNGVKVQALGDYHPNLSKDVIYIIAVNDWNVQGEFMAHLKSLGVSENSIFICDSDIEYEYWKGLPKDKYKEEVSCLYKEVFDKSMNWEHPSAYNEIICYEKVFADDNEKKAALVDKYRAREYVGRIIGKDHLVKLLGVWDKPENINFSELPNSFVLKTNCGSGQNILVKNKAEIDKDEVIRKLNNWMAHEYCYYGLTMHYKGIIPKVVCEEYLEGLAETVYDYDVFCFHGEPEYICCINGSHRKWSKGSWYDKEWNKIDGLSYGWPYDPGLAPKPKQLGVILDFSRKLSKEFKHCRVDWYIMPNGRVLFSEITFATWGGLMKFEPEIWDEKFGELI